MCGGVQPIYIALMDRVQSKAFRLVSSSPVLNINGQTAAGTMKVTEALVVLLSLLKPVASCRLTSPGFWIFHLGAGESYNTNFTMKELRVALCTCKRKTFPGNDNIPDVFIRHVSDETLYFLLNINNRIWREANIPLSWKSAVTIPIPKPGRD